MESSPSGRERKSLTGRESCDPVQRVESTGLPSVFVSICVVCRTAHRCFRSLSVAASLLQASLWPLFCRASENGGSSGSSTAIHERLPAVPEFGYGPQALEDALKEAHARGQKAMNGLRDFATLPHARYWRSTIWKTKISREPCSRSAKRTNCIQLILT